ncbi:unnamed protein product [Acanthosepion pharaonis]|uniref:Uncharacterized protein n=1 Tax=Acanthosepion pharaonis TaxID=158019 RepID=A0A812AQQ7_ACAPH|nr:unnamed protein product [Sepia pharaonis]
MVKCLLLSIYLSVHYQLLSLSINVSIYVSIYIRSLSHYLSIDLLIFCHCLFYLSSSAHIYLYIYLNLFISKCPNLFTSIYLSILIFLSRFKSFLSIFFSLLCRQGSLLGDQTPFFLHLFSSCPPGNYVFLLRPLEGENLLKQVLQIPLMNFFSIFFSGASSRGLLKTFSEGETCPQQIYYPCILHLWANAACLFSRESENEPLLSAVSFPTAAKVQSQFSPPPQKGAQPICLFFLPPSLSFFLSFILSFILSVLLVASPLFFLSFFLSFFPFITNSNPFVCFSSLPFFLSFFLSFLSFFLSFFLIS